MDQMKLKLQFSMLNYLTTNLEKKKMSMKNTFYAYGEL